MENHAIGYEVDILSAIMFSGADAFDVVCDHVDASDFFDRRNAMIFTTCAGLIAKSEPVSPEIIIERLRSSGSLDRVGGQENIASIVGAGSVSIKNLPSKAQWLAKLSGVRRMVLACSTVIEKASGFDGDLDGLLDYADNEIGSIRSVTSRTSSGLRHGKDVLKETIGNIERRWSNSSDLVGVDTGFHELNKILMGLAPKDLIILAALPGMGKTTLAMNIVENALKAKSPLGPVLFFSQEMGDSELMERIISSVGGIDQGVIRRGKLDDYHWASLTAATTQIKDWPLYIDETPGLTPSEMRSRCKRLRRQCGDQIGMIVVDYLQLMTVKGLEDNEVAKLSVISGSLKALAKEMNCPVLALSQLSRKVADRPNKRPMNSDLKGSGTIESDADVIMFIYRDEVFNPKTEKKGIAEIIINKHRKGATGAVEIGFDGRHSRFVNGRFAGSDDA